MVVSSADIQRAFLSAKRFAVVGASKDQTKFGTKVLKWYQVCLEFLPSSSEYPCPDML